MLPETATDRYQLVVDGESRAQQVTKETSYIARYLGKRVVRRLKRTIGR